MDRQKSRGRPKKPHRNEFFLTTLPPLLKARLEAQAVWESAQSSERISRAVIIRKGLLMYFKENPLPEGFFKEYIEQIEDEKEREKLLKLLEKHSKFDDVVYRP